MRTQLFYILLMLGACGLTFVKAGPYPPPAGQAGSTAIHREDPNIISWADGWENYNVGSYCDPVWQTPDNALGPAEGIVGEDHYIVSLGRGGSITLTFSTGIGDRPGFDFAVYENSLTNTFLELAYVEVSSDGVHFIRFTNDSLTPQCVGPYYGIVDATNITGLAGKYRQSYGTPFDLEELRGVSPHLDVNDVRWVRLIDIVGVGEECGSTYPPYDPNDQPSLDSSGDIIYDPYPTYGSAGFDLDAVAVLNMRTADFDDESGAVNELDMSLFAEAWLSEPEDENWNPRCDLAWPRDEVINLEDWAVFAGQWLAGI